MITDFLVFFWSLICRSCAGFPSDLSSTELKATTHVLSILPVAFVLWIDGQKGNPRMIHSYRPTRFVFSFHDECGSIRKGSSGWCVPESLTNPNTNEANRKETVTPHLYWDLGTQLSGFIVDTVISLDRVDTCFLEETRSKLMTRRQLPARASRSFYQATANKILFKRRTYVQDFVSARLIEKEDLEAPQSLIPRQEKMGVRFLSLNCSYIRTPIHLLLSRELALWAWAVLQAHRCHQHIYYWSVDSWWQRCAWPILLDMTMEIGYMSRRIGGKLRPLTDRRHQYIQAYWRTHPLFHLAPI